MTANTGWMLRYKENDLTIVNGHVFLEVWLEDRWHLVDPTYRYLFKNYDEKSKSYPRNEHFCRRVRDYWDAGIRSVADLDAAYRPVALSFETAAWKLASYSFVEIK